MLILMIEAFGIMLVTAVMLYIVFKEDDDE